MKKSWLVNSKEIKTRETLSMPHRMLTLHLLLQLSCSVFNMASHSDEAGSSPLDCAALPTPCFTRTIPSAECLPFLTPPALHTSVLRPALRGKHPWPRPTRMCLLVKTHHKHLGRSRPFSSVKPCGEGRACFCLFLFLFPFFGDEGADSSNTWGYRNHKITTLMGDFLSLFFLKIYLHFVFNYKVLFKMSIEKCERKKKFPSSQG